MAQCVSPRVLIAVDGSGFADEAFKWYCDVVHKKGNKVFLCHVREPIVQQKFGFRVGLAITEQQWDQAMKELEKKEETVLAAYRRVLEENQITYEIAPAFGDPGFSICQAARDKEVNLIVTGSRGQGKVRRTILGSVSDYVLHHSHCPVAVCHKKTSQP